MCDARLRGLTSEAFREATLNALIGREALTNKGRVAPCPQHSTKQPSWGEQLSRPKLGYQDTIPVFNLSCGREPSYSQRSWD